MRYLCLISGAFAATTFCCAYGLPRPWLLPLAGVLLGLGLAALLVGLRHRRRWLTRVMLCLLSAALALGAYARYWTGTVAPAQQWDGQTATAVLELRAAPSATPYGYSVPGWMTLEGTRLSVLCYLDADEVDDRWRPGDQLAGTFTLSLPSDEDEAGLEPGYLRATGVYLTAAPAGTLEAYRPTRLPLRCWPAMVREQMSAACRALFSEQTESWFLALLTNRAGEISYADKNDLKLSGLYHIMSTSGMHINVLMGLVSMLCLHRRRLAAMIGLPLCGFFWAMAGGAPPVSRAVVMQTLLLLAPLLRQEEDTATSMALALLLILLGQPDSIAHLGLQLSFLSVGGIALFAPRIYRWAMGLLPLARAGKVSVLRRVVSSLASTFATAVGAMLLTTPLLVQYEGTVALLSPLTGWLVLPLVTACFALGLPVTLLSALWPTGAAVLAWPLEGLMRCVIALTRLAADLPVLYVSSPYWVGWLVMAYGFALLLWLGHLRPRVPLICLALSFVLTLGLHTLDLRRSLPTEGFRLTVLDVGQGQCLVVQLGTSVCVIDCGGSWPEDAGETCARYLLGQGIRQIDLLALTHYHADHAGGVRQLLSRVPAAQLWLPDVPDETGTRAAIVAAAGAADLRWITEDSTLPLGGGTVSAWAPRSLANDNEACLALMVSRDGDDLLVTGDMDRLTEILLCKTAELPDIEVFIAGHHGSRTANGPVLLARTRPELVIVSAGDRYGHPHAEALERFAAAGAVVYSTQTMGNITVVR